MRKPFALLVCIIAIAAAGCGPHGRGAMRALRHAGGHGGMRQECSQDIQQFCAADQTGRDKRACLKEHEAQLSAGCKAALQAREERRAGRRNKDNPAGSDNSGNTP